MKLKWEGEKVTGAVRQAARRALYEGAEVILKESKAIVPHASGSLERSGTVSPPMPADTIYISYNTPYARRQHEELNWRHPDPTNPISSSGRSAKYLEIPFNKNKQKVIRNIGRAIERALNK